ncbi:MAG: hypothetical protein CL931_00045 [Deltaproteobacteria bacterium]|nr:hypothetical protein [Deltaproteobacteria bacterium]
MFTPTGVHNALSQESRQFIDDMLVKGEQEAFKNITPEKFWTVVLPAVTYVKMAQYIKEVQQSNETEEPEVVEDAVGDELIQEENLDGEVEDSDESAQPEVPLEAFDG